jgi:hypothetical protein
VKIKNIYNLHYLSWTINLHYGIKKLLEGGAYSPVAPPPPRYATGLLLRKRVHRIFFDSLIYFFKLFFLYPLLSLDICWLFVVIGSTFRPLNILIFLSLTSRAFCLYCVDITQFHHHASTNRYTFNYNYRFGLLYDTTILSNYSLYFTVSKIYR